MGLLVWLRLAVQALPPPWPVSLGLDCIWARSPDKTLEIALLKDLVPLFHQAALPFSKYYPNVQHG